MPSLRCSAETWHTFTDFMGRKLEAKILRVDFDFVVVELKASGKQLPLDFDKLSDEDLDYIARYEEPGEATGQGKAATSPSEEGLPEGEPETGRLYPRSKEEIRSGIREINSRKKPEGISREVFAATQQLNIYRFLCGVPSDVEPDAEFSKNADDAALACKKNGGLSHTIGHSTNKCNLSTVGNMERSVSQYIQDSGDNNRDGRGHRAWCLNPPMKRVGFGTGGDSYSAMWCMNSEGKSIRGTWTYPGKGLFPLEYMHGNAWSLYGVGKPESPDKIKIEIFRLSKRPETPFSAGADIPGREIKINHVSTAMMNGINFEPEEPAKRGIYWVRVNGGGIHEGYLVELY
jgi:hypothetical protein